MIKGVNHVGIGVSDIENSLGFYRDILGFKMIWDHIDVVPRVDYTSRNENVRIREVMLRSQKPGPMGNGGVKLIQTLPPHKAMPIDRKYLWGEPGIAEFALNVHNIEDVLEYLEKNKVEIILSPQYIVLNGKQVKYAYIRDVDSILIELIELAVNRSFGGPPRIEGVNHVGIGVSDIENSLGFYRDILGFKETLWDHTDTFEGIPPLDKDSSLGPTKMRIVMLVNESENPWIEIIQRMPLYKSKPKPSLWGHIGHTEFGVKVSNIEKVCNQLQRKNVQLLFPPRTTIFHDLGEWKKIAALDPDHLYVSFVEA